MPRPIQATIHTQALVDNLNRVRSHVPDARIIHQDVQPVQSRRCGSDGFRAGHVQVQRLRRL